MKIKDMKAYNEGKKPKQLKKLKNICLTGWTYQ